MVQVGLPRDSKLYARPLFGVLSRSNPLEQMKATLNTERNWSVTVKSSANPMGSSETGRPYRIVPNWGRG